MTQSVRLVRKQDMYIGRTYYLEKEILILLLVWIIDFYKYHELQEQALFLG